MTKCPWYEIPVPDTRADQSVMRKYAELASRADLRCRSTLKAPVSYSWSKQKGSIGSEAIVQVVRRCSVHTSNV